MQQINFDDLYKIRVLISTDVVLECFMNCNGYVDDAEEVLQLAKLQRIQAYVTDYCLQTVGFYLSKPEARVGQEAVSKIRVILSDRIIHVTRNLIDDAINSSIKNIDAAVELSCAIAMNVGAIVTQDPKKFEKTGFSVLTINEFIERQYLEENSHELTYPFILESNFKSFESLESILQIQQEFSLNSFGINSRNDLAAYDLQDADLRGVDLGGMILRGADLRRSNMQNAVLTFTCFSYAKLSNADLRRADLRGANLSLAMLSESDLSFSNLSNSNLSNADLSDSQLREANLRAANLKGVDLRDADLQCANLLEAKLEGVSWQGANVSLAKFGRNTGISERLKVDLIQRGAIFLEDRFGESSISMKL